MVYMMKIADLICKWKGHLYDKMKYRADLVNFHFAHRHLLLKTREEVENYYNNPPLPFCFRCKREIE